MRSDRRPGSFSVNTRTGRWADFATGDRCGDVVSLAAYLHGLRQAEAARKLADMLGLPVNAFAQDDPFAPLGAGDTRQSTRQGGGAGRLAAAAGPGRCAGAGRRRK